MSLSCVECYFIGVLKCVGCVIDSPGEQLPIKIDDKVFNPLTLGCLVGSLKIVKCAIEAGGKVNQTDEEGYPPLFRAIQGGNIDVVKFVVQHGADVQFIRSSPIAKFSALDEAIATENSEICHYLIESGAIIDHRGKFGFTSLFFAVEKGVFSMVKFLIQRGADINSKDDFGNSPLHVAIGACAFTWASNELNADEVDEEGAVAYQKKLQSFVQTIQLLITEGVDLEIANKQGVFALHLACGNTLAGGSIIEMLCAAGAKIEAKSAGMFTPLCFSCEVGDPDSVKILLRYGADVNAFGWNRNTGLHLASWGGFDQVLQLLFQQGGVDVNSQNVYGHTALHLATLQGHVATAKLLIANGAQMDIQDKDGNTVLHAAVKLQNEELVKIFFSTPGINLTTTNHFGVNAFTYANLVMPDTVQLLFPNRNSKFLQAEFLNEKFNAPLHFVNAAQVVVPTISLQNVKLVSVTSILSCDAFPHYNKCEQNGWHITATDIELGKKVLFVSHRWGSMLAPDPTNEQFQQLQYFIEESEVEFDYIWLDYSCICQDRNSELFKIHVQNIPTAVWVASHCVIIPKLVNVDTIHNAQKLPVSDLVDYLGRAWCVLESLACILSGTEVICSFQAGDKKIQVPLISREGAGPSFGFSSVCSFALAVLFSKPEEANVDFAEIKPRWFPVDPFKVLELLLQIYESNEPQIQAVLEKSLCMKLQVDDIQGVSSPVILELWKLLGDCAFEADKIVVFKLILFIGYYSINKRNAQTRTAGVSLTESSIHESQELQAKENSKHESQVLQSEEILVRGEIIVPLSENSTHKQQFQQSDDVSACIENVSEPNKSSTARCCGWFKL